MEKEEELLSDRHQIQDDHQSESQNKGDSKSDFLLGDPDIVFFDADRNSPVQAVGNTHDHEVENNERVGETKVSCNLIRVR